MPFIQRQVAPVDLGRLRIDRRDRGDSNQQVPGVNIGTEPSFLGIKAVEFIKTSLDQIHRHFEIKIILIVGF